MEHGATMPATREGTTPFMIACAYGSMDIIEFLVENGADVNADLDVDGFNPIIRAALKRRDQVVRYLLRQGADPFTYRQVRT